MTAVTPRRIVNGDQEYQDLLAKQLAQASADDENCEGYFYQDFPEAFSLGKPGPHSGEA